MWLWCCGSAGVAVVDAGGVVCCGLFWTLQTVVRCTDTSSTQVLPTGFGSLARISKNCCCSGRLQICLEGTVGSQYTKTRLHAQPCQCLRLPQYLCLTQCLHLTQFLCPTQCIRLPQCLHLPVPLPPSVPPPPSVFPSHSYCLFPSASFIETLSFCFSPVLFQRHHYHCASSSTMNLPSNEHSLLGSPMLIDVMCRHNSLCPSPAADTDTELSEWVEVKCA